MRKATVTRMLPTNAKILTKEITAVSVEVTIWKHDGRSTKASKLVLLFMISSLSLKCDVRSISNKQEESLEDLLTSPPVTDVKVGQRK